MTEKSILAECPKRSRADVSEEKGWKTKSEYLASYKPLHSAQVFLEAQMELYDRERVLEIRLVAPKVNMISHDFF